MKNRILQIIIVIGLLLCLGSAAAAMEVVTLSPDEPRAVLSGGTVALPSGGTPHFSGAVTAEQVAADSEKAVYRLEGYGPVRVECEGIVYEVLLTDWQRSSAGDKGDVEPYRAAIFDSEGFRANPQSFANRLYVLATLIRPEGPDDAARPSASSSWVQIAADDWLLLHHADWTVEDEQQFIGLVEVSVDDAGIWFLTAHQRIEDVTAKGFGEPSISMEDGALVMQRPVSREIPVGTLLYAALLQTRSSGMQLLVHGDAVETIHYQSYLQSFQELVLVAARPGSADIEILYSRYGKPAGEDVVSFTVY